MGRVTKAKAYLRVRRWVDHDLANHHRPASLFLGVVPTLWLAFSLRLVEGRLALIGWTIAILACAVWTGLVLWRAFRLFRALGIKGDRQYDQRDKFALSPEYRHSESVTAARQRLRAARPRTTR